MPIDRDQVVWRYLPKGRVKHALRVHPTLKGGHYDNALCPIGVTWWLGERWCGGDKAPRAERDRLATLPECKHCAAKLAPKGESHGVGS